MKKILVILILTALSLSLVNSIMAYHHQDYGWTYCEIRVNDNLYDGGWGLFSCYCNGISQLECFQAEPE